MVRLPPLGLAVFHVYDSPDSPMTLRSDTLLRLSGRGVTARASDPLPVRSQQSDSQTFYISSQTLTLGFSGTTGLLEVCVFIDSCFCWIYIWIKDLLFYFLTLIFWRNERGKKKTRWHDFDFPVNPGCVIKANIACHPFISFLNQFFSPPFDSALSSSSFMTFFFYLQSIKRKDDPQEVKVQMQFVVYGTRPSKDKSGAYLFLPDGKAKVCSQLLYLRCLLASQKTLIESPLCIVSSCRGARGKKAGKTGCCFIFLLSLKTSVWA